MPRELIHLDSRWRLAGFDGYGETIDAIGLPTALPNLRWIDATVPGSVYLDLMRAGWIADVYSGCNSLAAQWVEQHYWFYRTTFDAPRLDDRHCHLVFDSLDLDARIFLNGALIAAHCNVFRPCRIDVTSRLRETGNDLVVRVDAGLLGAADQPGSRYNREVTAAVTSRAYLRKPHYACRWDWSPRLMNVGIAGDVRLEVIDQARFADVAVHATADNGLTVRVFVENLSNTAMPVTMRMTVTSTDGDTHRNEFTRTIPPGTTRLECAVRPDHPQLWWPRGFGDQPLYDVKIELLHDGRLLDAANRRTAIRTIELRQPAADRGTLFQLAVNGELVFCKGANWVPADLLRPRVTAGDYKALIDLACEMNCNMLRVWGGGLYESDEFYAACDRAGILVWQDLAFACTTYPADDPAFVAEIEAEVRHNVRRLAHHPSLILWCGNNEIDLGVADGWIACTDEARSSNRRLFHETMQEWVTSEDPSRPYWPTSPSSPDGSHPNARHTGDQHPWDVGLGAAKGDYWQYRDDASRFPNEGGILGPSTPKTLKQILPEPERHVGSRIWMHHDNTQNTWRGEPMIDHLLRTNLCNEPRNLAFDDYVRYAAILHGEALETAIDNWRRRKFDTSAAVFWMFNDTWPAVTSWTPIDFYRRRKPAFWYARRAFQPIRAICVELDGEVKWFIVNDTLQAQKLRLQFGLFALSGGRPIDEPREILSPPNSSQPVASLPLSHWNELGTRTHGAFAVLWQDDRCLSTHRLFRERFRDLAWTPAAPQARTTPNGLELSSDTFAWTVCLDDTGEHPLADNWFDLIPGIPRAIAWEEGLPAFSATAANPPSTIINPPGA